MSTAANPTTPATANLFNLNDQQTTALKFGLNSLFFASTTGLMFGAVTNLMKGWDNTPAGRANMLRSIKLFSVAGFTYGSIGASLINIRGEDDYYNRMTSGCAAGLALGIANRSMSAACFSCVSLGALATLAKFFDTYSDLKPHEDLKVVTQPRYLKDMEK